MMRSLYSGVSGLRTHQTRMDVIGNNIANVNTTAYKAKTMNFSDMLYQTTQAATGANASRNTGGTNPRQIGLGVKGAAINTSITQEGANQSTGNPFDLKISGEAFFVVSDGISTYYTRDGSFDVDDAGNLCMASTGYIVQGWGVDNEGNIVQGTVGPLNVMARNEADPAATTMARITGIIDSEDSNLQTTNGVQRTVPIFDKAGYSYNVKFGILPVTSDQTVTRDIANTENEYTMGPIYKVDTSKLTYSYKDNEGGAGTRYLSSSANPEIMEALEKAIWDVVISGTETTAIKGSHKLGEADSNIHVNLQAFIEENPTFDESTLDLSALRKITDLTVSFSGESGFISATEVPTYPLSSNVNIVKLSQDAVDCLYEEGDGNEAYKLYTQKYEKVTSLKQTYDDDNNESQTDYTFRTGTEETPIEVTSDLGSDVARLLDRLNSAEPTVNMYTTQEDKTISTVEPGRFTISLLGMTDVNGDDVNIDTLLSNATTSWDVVYETGNGQFSYVGQEGEDSFTLNLSMINNLGNFENLTVDMSNTSNQGNEKVSALEGKRLDGYKVGKMTGVSIGTDGLITALYSNGVQETLGQVCVGTFQNAMGLENAGDNLYQVTAGSGDVSIVDIKASGTGVMTTGILEMSNVDLSQQFTDMITTQRGFQANSRIITTSDSMLEELVNLKR